MVLTMAFHKLYCQIILILTLFTVSTHANISQKTFYDYDNRTLYIHLNDNNSSINNNTLFKIPFNSHFTSGSDLSSSIITPPPNNLCEIVYTSASLYAFCPNNNYLSLYQYNHSSNSWEFINVDLNLPYYLDSNYLYTNSDNNAIYIFSGLMTNSTKLSDQMLRLDLNTLQISNASSRIQPQPFYKSSTVQINQNTQALLGGISSDNSLVSMMEIPLWQYNSWAERPSVSSLSRGIDSRINSLILPIFDESNLYFLNNSISSFEVSSLLLLGGKDLNDKNVYPQIASLNISTNIWKWNDKTNSLLVANNNINNGSVTLNISSIIGAATIYDALLTISNNDKNEYTLNIYNATTYEYLKDIDYSSLSKLRSPMIIVHNNKNLIIALSIIIPVLLIIIITCLLLWLYKKYKIRKEIEMNEREIKEIVDFYENQHKQNSNITFSSLDSDYKSSDNENYNYFYNGIKINDYNGDNDNGDNLSIDSWKRKRREFENQYQYKYNNNGNDNNFPSSKLNFSPKNFNLVSKTRSNSLMRSLSVASNFINDSLSKSNSTKSSQPFISSNKNIIQDNPFENAEVIASSASSINSLNLPQQPPPAVPKHSSLLFTPKNNSHNSNSLLNYIPENYSVSTFHSQTLGSIPLLVNLPQQQYMNKLNKRPSICSISSYDDNQVSVYPNSCNSLTSSSINKSRSRSPSRSLSRSPSRSPNKISHKTFGRISNRSSIRSSNDYANPFRNSEINTISENDYDYDKKVDEHDDQGSITDDENLDVQVLVGCKRRSKLKVVNPDAESNHDNEDSKSLDIVDMNVDEKNRCTSTGSQESNDSLRKRNVSGEKVKDDE